MFKFSKSHAYSIGVDTGDDSLKLVQLGEDGNGISLIAGQSENLPEGVKASSSQWQNGTIRVAGAVTFGSGSSGVSGVVSAANSLVGVPKPEPVLEILASLGGVVLPAIGLDDDRLVAAFVDYLALVTEAWGFD